MHCVLLPPVTSVHLASFESTYNYMYTIASGQSTIILETKSLEEKTSPKHVSKKMLAIQCNIYLLSYGGHEWNGTVLSQYSRTEPVPTTSL